ncbi:MAG: hypothetical protein LIP16_12475 [Clostridium sp.]|nr:hypothetical protein [Clostridium sp.]
MNWTKWLFCPVRALIIYNISFSEKCKGFCEKVENYFALKPLIPAQARRGVTVAETIT